MSSSVLVTGSSGMLGSAICRNIKCSPTLGKHKLLTPSRSELNLENQNEVLNYFEKNNIEIIFHAAAKVGGIKANIDFPADFINKNLSINSNVFEAARQFNVSKLLFFGSSCIYPKDAPVPIQESSLMKGELEQSNYAYSVSKIAGITQCNKYAEQYGCDFRVLMPTNLYGINDNYEKNNSHVIPALISKFYMAVKDSRKEIKIWGSGNAVREFLHIDDLVSASFRIISLDQSDYTNLLSDNNVTHLNVGSFEEISIHDLCVLLKKISGYDGEIVFDDSYPEGVMRKTLCSRIINSIGWKPKIELIDGLDDAYLWYCNNFPNLRH